MLPNGQFQDDYFPAIVRYAGASLRATIKIPATAEPIQNKSTCAHKTAARWSFTLGIIHELHEYPRIFLQFCGKKIIFAVFE